MGYILTILFLTAIAKAICIRFRKNCFFNILPGTMFFVVLFTYVCGLASHLNWGAYAFSLAGAVSLIYCAYVCIRHKSMRIFMDRQLILFLSIALFIFLAHFGRTLTHGDEYSHWALTVKNMFYIDRMANDPLSVTTYKDYPPATAILEYLIMKIGGKYTEADLFRGISLFSVVPLLAIANGLIGTAKKNDFIFYSLIICAIPAILYYAYTETLVDCSLGIYFGFLLVSSVQYCEEKKGIHLLNGITAAAMLALLKSSGLGFVIIAIVILLFDSIERKERKAAFVFLFSVLAAALIASQSWQFALQLHGGPSANESWNIEAVGFADFAGRVQSLERSDIAIVTDFVKSYIYPNNSLNLINVSYLLWTIMLCGTLLIISMKYHTAGKGLAAGLAVGEIGYAASILWLYLFLWEHALQDGSFYRYMNSFFLGAMLICGFVAAKETDFIKKNSSPVKTKLIILFVFLSLCRPLELARLFAGPMNLLAGKVEYQEKYTVEELTQNGTIEELAVGYTGSPYDPQTYKMRYELVPYRVICDESKEKCMKVAKERGYKYLFMIEEDRQENVLIDLSAADLP